jgi:hypothetical protein
MSVAVVAERETRKHGARGEAMNTVDPAVGSWWFEFDTV